MSFRMAQIGRDFYMNRTSHGFKIILPARFLSKCGESEIEPGWPAQNECGCGGLICGRELDWAKHGDNGGKSSKHGRSGAFARIADI
jgi:hypothetical protein